MWNIKTTYFEFRRGIIIKAKKLFEKLGYKLIRNDDDYIIYSRELKEHEDEDTRKEISFCDQLQDFTVSFVNTKSRQTPGVDMELFNAIHKQLLELEWIK